MRLYDRAASFNSRRVRGVAAQLRIELEIETVELKEGQHQSPDYLTLNPNALVPPPPSWPKEKGS